MHAILGGNSLYSRRRSGCDLVLVFVSERNEIPRKIELGMVVLITRTIATILKLELRFEKRIEMKSCAVCPIRVAKL